MKNLKKAFLLVLILVSNITVTKASQIYKSVDGNWIKQRNTNIDIKLEQNKIDIISDDNVTYFVYNATISKLNGIKVYSMSGFINNGDVCSIVVCDYGDGHQIMIINTVDEKVKYIIKD